MQCVFACNKRKQEGNIEPTASKQRTNPQSNALLVSEFDVVTKHLLSKPNCVHLVCTLTCQSTPPPNLTNYCIQQSDMTVQGVK